MTCKQEVSICKTFFIVIYSLILLDSADRDFQLHVQYGKGFSEEMILCSTRVFGMLLGINPTLRMRMNS